MEDAAAKSGGYVVDAAARTVAGAAKGEDSVDYGLE